MVPASLRRVLEHQLGGPPSEVKLIGGGDINRAAKWTLASGKRCFLKWNPEFGGEAFEVEAEGLHHLSLAKELRVPEVIAFGEGGGIGFLLLEWIEPSRSENWQALGRGLAALHRHTSNCFGYEVDNLIGRLPQLNGWYDVWPRFWAEQRIGFQMELAAEEGLLPSPLVRRIERLCTEAEKACTRPSAVASLLHGDLWRGNVMFSGDAPVLIDPAVYYGDREVELAFTELFGGFGTDFYAAYRESFPLADGYENRRGFWQLYPLLVHLNLFGQSYLSGVERAVAAGEALL
jgi:fructosamine-3-kinase